MSSIVSELNRLRDSIKNLSAEEYHGLHSSVDDVLFHHFISSIRNESNGVKRYKKDHLPRRAISSAPKKSISSMYLPTDVQVFNNSEAVVYNGRTIYFNPNLFEIHTTKKTVLAVKEGVTTIYE